MKACLVSVLFFALIISCSSNTENKNNEEISEPESSVQADAIAIGEALVGKSDCSICHHKVNQIMGPSHTAVAEKYEFTSDNVKLIAGRIINGGSGVWGEILMTPHTDISQEDAENMARYILSLDGEKEH